jgi:uncharacterized membrane protein YgaE (UPF0421/DUF939 family)
MDIKKIIEIVTDVENKPNKDLSSAESILFEEFEKTKSLIIELTEHLDKVEESYLIITKEIQRRRNGK